MRDVLRQNLLNIINHFILQLLVGKVESNTINCLDFTTFFLIHDLIFISMNISDNTMNQPKKLMATTNSTTSPARYSQSAR
jgi:hypothetical protein